MKNIYLYNTIIGQIRIVDNGEEIIEIEINEEREEQEEGYRFEETALIKRTHEQLDEYFKGERKTFDLPLHLEGTEFQKKVWKALLEIPYGEIRSYKDVAERIGCPKGYRAVGNANNKNNIIIVIPCHRVIGANGKLVGYACGLDIKEKLLGIEKILI